MRADLEFFGDTLGMRLDMIYPADDPRVAVYSGHGLRVRLEQGAGVNPALRILTDNPGFADGAHMLTSPGGTQVEVLPLDPPLDLPKTDHAFVLRRLVNQAPSGNGKAPYPLAPGGCLCRPTPPGMQTRYADPSDDLELLEVALPGDFVTAC